MRIFSANFVNLILENKSDANEPQADDSNEDGESDNETNTSMLTDTNAGISQGKTVFSCIEHSYFDFFIFAVSSGLLLLAAAAEQKRKDEAGRIRSALA